MERANLTGYLFLVVHFCLYNPGLNDELWEEAFNVLLLFHLKHMHSINRVSIFSSYFSSLLFLSVMWNVELVFFIWNENVSSSQIAQAI